jgi:Tannase-like family of unknown function (DUF6351)
LAAANAAYTLGIVFRGDIDIPVIDWRHYLQHRLDMHNSHPSFASRKRMLNFDGDASHQVIWFTEARPGAPQFRPDADGSRRHGRVDAHRPETGPPRRLVLRDGRLAPLFRKRCLGWDPRLAAGRTRSPTSGGLPGL